MSTVRHMLSEDAGAVSALLRQSWRETYSSLIGEEKALQTSAAWHAPENLASEAADENVICFVAEDVQGRIIGHAMAQMDGGRQAWLRRLYVTTDQHGTGVATDLLHAVLAAHAGLPAIALEVMEGNGRAIAFYRKNGFIEAERRQNCGGIDDVPTIVMTKPLPRA